MGDREYKNNFVKILRRVLDRVGRRKDESFAIDNRVYFLRGDDALRRLREVAGDFVDHLERDEITIDSLATFATRLVVLSAQYGAQLEPTTSDND